MEIERKFLIDKINFDLEKYKSKYIKQQYLYKDIFTAIRKRLIIQNNVSKYFYTIKTNKNGFSVNEIEKEITQDEYDKLNNENNTEIIKTRYIIPYQNYKIELDIFDGEYKGLMFAEVEFKNETEAIEFEKNIPEWFVIEISNDITNADMATTNPKVIWNKIERLKNKNI